MAELRVSGQTDPRLSVWESRSLRILIWALIALAIVMIFQGAQYIIVHVFNVLLLFIFAAIMALILTPLVDRMQRIRPFRDRRSLAVLVLYILGVGVVAGGIALVVPTLLSQGRALPVLMTDVDAALRDHGIPFQLNALNRFTNGDQLGAALSVIETIVAGVVNLVLVMVISIYLLIDGRGVLAAARNLFPSRQSEFDFIALAVGSTVAAYVRGQVIMSVIIGTYTGVALTLLGVHYGVVIGVAAFFLEFIPIIGAVVAMVLAVVVALLQGPGLAVLAGLVGLVGHAMDGYIIGPRVNGRVTQLHPLVAMGALLVGAELDGVLGALFAIPFAAVANIFLGAMYRSRRGDHAMTTAADGEVTAATLPRLGEEVAAVEGERIEGEPVPHVAED